MGLLPQRRFLYSRGGGGLPDVDIKSYPETSIISRIADAVPPIFLFLAGALGTQVDARKLIWRAGLVVGDASYSLYLIHPFALRAFAKIWIKLVGTHLPVWTFTLLCPVLALAAGLACYYLAERPLLKLFSSPRPALKPNPSI